MVEALKEDAAGGADCFGISLGCRLLRYVVKLGLAPSESDRTRCPVPAATAGIRPIAGAVCRLEQTRHANLPPLPIMI